MAQKIFRVRVVTYKLCKQSARQEGAAGEGVQEIMNLLAGGEGGNGNGR